MTDTPQDPTSAGDELERFRDDFGRSLFSAAREHERTQAVSNARPRRRRRAAIGFATAAAAVVLVVTALPSPGDRDAPLLGASPAEAAVQELQRSLREGVLVRRAEITQPGDGAAQRQTQEDWTDLSTRQQHVRITSSDPKANSEYWNPSKHERWGLESKRSADGRQIVAHTIDQGQENISSTESPAEEVDRLLADARNGELVVVRRTVENGGREVLVVERRQQCYATPDGATGMCPDPEEPSRWPEDAPATMRPVTSFQTWWLEVGATPRILREENGNVAYGTSKRDVQYRSRYTRWDVLPATAKTLSLVRTPAFPADRFLVVQE